MTQSTALAWKEWREIRIYLWIGWFVFLVLPVIAAVENVSFSSRPFSLSISPTEIVFGGVLAVFVAVAATCRDLKGRLEDFWRSQPVSVVRWMLTKYFIGLIVVLAICVVPVLVEFCIDRKVAVHPAVMLGIFPFHWAAVYSLAFAGGCLLRKPAHAAMVGLAALLLVWFLPLVLPPLAWLNLEAIEPESIADLWNLHTQIFMGTMLLVSTVSIIAALVAVHRHWHIESGVRLLFGSIAGVVIIALASASYQLGTDLPLLQNVELPIGGYVRSIYYGKSFGYGVNTGEVCVYRSTGPLPKDWEADYFSINLTPAGITLGKPAVGHGDIWYMRPELTTPDGTAIQYEIGTENNENTGPLKLTLHSQPKGGVPSQTEITGAHLWTIGGEDALFGSLVWENRLYVIGSTLVYDQPEGQKKHSHYELSRVETFDISNPLEPRMLTDVPFSFRFGQDHIDAERCIKVLPPVPGLPARGRLALVLRQPSIDSERNGNELLFARLSQSIAEYRLSSITDSVAVYDKIGESKLSMIEPFFGVSGTGEFYYSDGFLYVTRYGGGTIRPMLYVYDTRGPQPMRLVAHYANSDPAWQFCTLPDGRVLIGGSKLWLIGAPPGHARE